MKLINFWKKLLKQWRGKKKKPRKKTFKKKPLKKTSKKAAPKTKKKSVKKPLKKVSKPTPKPKEKEIGVITHYFGKISVGIIKLKSTLKVGEKIHIKGAHDDFTQPIKSMQINHKDVPQAKKGDEIGIKVTNPVHQNDKVYKLP